MYRLIKIDLNANVMFQVEIRPIGAIGSMYMSHETYVKYYQRETV